MASGTVRTSAGLTAMLNAHFKGTANAPNETQVGTGTTTPSVSDTTIETQSGSDLAIDANYPNVTGQTAEVRTTLGTTAQNGNTLSEFTTVDSSDALLTHSVFTGQAKTSSDIFIMVEKLKIRNRGGSL